MLSYLDCKYSATRAHGIGTLCDRDWLCASGTWAYHLVLLTPIGWPAEALIADGFEAVDRPRKLRKTPDVIHGHQNVSTLMAAFAFPNTPCLFICHDGVSEFDAAPPPTIVNTYAAVDQLTTKCMAREVGITLEHVFMVANVVDLDAFTKREDAA